MFNQQPQQDLAKSNDPVTLESLNTRIDNLFNMIDIQNELRSQISFLKGKVHDLEFENKLLKKQYEDLFKLFEGAIRNA